MSEEGKKKRMQNLRPLNTRTPEERKAVQKKGNEAACRTHKFARFIRTAIQAELDKKLQTNNGSTINGREAIANALMREASKGNVKAIELLVKYAGEEPAQKMEVTGKNGSQLIPPKTLTKEEARELLNGLENDY